MREADQILLQPVLDIAAVQSLRDALLHALAAGAAVSLHAGAVERVDAAALQLLYSFIKTADAKGLAWTWSEPSDVIGSAVALCGMREVVRFAD